MSILALALRTISDTSALNLSMRPGRRGHQVVEIGIKLHGQCPLRLCAADEGGITRHPSDQRVGATGQQQLLCQLVEEGRCAVVLQVSASSKALQTWGRASACRVLLVQQPNMAKVMRPAHLHKMMASTHVCKGLCRGMHYNASLTGFPGRSFSVTSIEGACCHWAINKGPSRSGAAVW